MQNVSHVQAVERHPRSPVRLSQRPTRGQWLRPVEDTYVIETKETSFEDVVATLVLAIDPPVCMLDGLNGKIHSDLPSEVQQELLEHSLQELQVFTAI